MCMYTGFVYNLAWFLVRLRFLPVGCTLLYAKYPAMCTIWLVLGPITVLATGLCGPVFVDLGLWTCICGPGRVDLDLRTWACEPGFGDMGL